MAALRRLIASVALLCASATQAAVGLLELPAVGDDGPVTVFYPSGDAEARVQRGPFVLSAAWQGAPQRGNGRLVVLSHGSGGVPWVQADLARALVQAGFVVALPQHRGDHAGDMSLVGPASWRLRPLEVSRSIDAVASDARFAPLLRTDRVGMYGMSAGGHAALTLAGGRWSPARLMAHCEAHIAEDFHTCAGPNVALTGGPFDGLKKATALAVISNRLGDPQEQGHTDPRIVAIVAGVPFAADFDPASLRQPAAALALVAAQQDHWLVPRFHSTAVLQACAANCTLLADFAQGGHGALLSPRPPRLSAGLDRLLGDPPGFDRREVAAAYARIVEFFDRQLLP
jgi:predicted dienelactone hydrolase